MKIEKLRIILTKSYQHSGKPAGAQEELARLDAALKKFDHLTVKQIAKKLQVAKS
ncbi:MAG: hypothetical protein AAFR90_14980 [Pseudomonadota bacterium]